MKIGINRFIEPTGISTLKQKALSYFSFNPIRVFATDSFCKTSSNSSQTIGVKTIDSYILKVRDCFKYFLSNKSEVEDVITNADFEKYAREGLPLIYSRHNFISDLNREVKNYSHKNRDELFKKLQINPSYDSEGNFDSYEGLITTENLTNNAKNDKNIMQLIDKFTKNNKVITDNESFNQAMNSLIAAFPEWINIIGKQQHLTQSYSVDVHMLKVMKEILKNSDFKELSDKDKTKIKLAAIFHDIGKKESEIHTGHQYVSSEHTANILKRIKMPFEIKTDICEMISNHHWLAEYNKGEKKALDIAIMFRNYSSYKMAKIFAEADLKAVSPSFYDLHSHALSQEKMQLIETQLDNILKTGNLIFTSKIVNKSKIPVVTVNKDNYRVINLTDYADNDDMESVGFVKGTRKCDLRFIVHFLSCMDKSDYDRLESIDKIISDKIKKNTFSTSFISTSDNRSFAQNRLGLLLNVTNENIITALDCDQQSGQSKKLETSFSEEERKFLKNHLVNIINNGQVTISSDSDYINLYRQLSEKKYLSQIGNIEINNAKIEKDSLVQAIKESQDKLFYKGKSKRFWDWNELVVYKPEISGIVYKDNSIDKIDQDILNFAKERDLPIILLGK